MSRFSELLEKINNLTSLSARFRRVVLHAHSPMSHDFGEPRGSDTTLNNKKQYLSEGGEEKFIKFFNRSVDLISITDHMKQGYACQLSKWAMQNDNDVIILPGIELNIRLEPPLNQMKLHMLVIFPGDKHPGEIEKILPAGIPVDEERKGTEEIDIHDLAGFVRDIRENHQGICIAAHVDGKNGARLLFRQTGKKTISLFDPNGKLDEKAEREISDSFKDFLVSIKFDGIEITKPEDRVHYTWKTTLEGDITHHVPVFLTFDAHNIETLQALAGEKKDRVTYVKMADVSWQGLKTAIQFPLTRIRFSDDRVPPPYILGIEIVSGSQDGFFSNLTIGFIENLNCLIGPRGSGKSTIIDALRYVFGYNRTLDELESPDLKDAVLNRQKATLGDSIIRVAYRVDDNKIHFLEATYDSKSDYVTRVYDSEGNKIPINDVERSGEYPLRLFGWSEIETLGRSPDRQMDLLDKLVEGLQNLLDHRNEIRSRLRINTQEVVQQVEILKSIFERNNGEIGKYQEYLHDFNLYNTKEVETLFTNLDKYGEQNKLLREFKDAIDDVLNNVSDLHPVDFNNSVEELLNENAALNKWWKKVSKDDLDLSSIHSSINNDFEQVKSKVDSLQQLVDGMVLSIVNESENIETQIREKLNTDPKTQVLADLRSQAKTRLDTVNDLRKEYLEAFDKFSESVDERSQILDELLDCQNKISQLRQTKRENIAKQLNEFQTPDMVVEIVLTREGDRTNFENYLENLSDLSDVYRFFRSRRWPKLLSDACTPVQFAKAILDKEHSSLVVNQIIDDEERSISNEQAIEIIDTISPISENEAASVKVIDAEKVKTLLEIQELEWEDKISILRNGQPVENGSPGQRSSAMLPLIALAEKVPLIIDQPEDNLDNRLVGKILVDILAKLKEKRQIIVSTHNPNIVVLGDAEQVIVLDADDNEHGHVDEPQASIDHPEIIKRVIDLMEGGREAFDTRSKRYASSR